MGISADVNVTCCGFNAVSFVAGSASATGNIDVQAADHPISGNVPAGFSIDIEGGGRLNSQTDYTNAGTITLNGADAELRTANGNNADTETLTNTGTIAYAGSTGIEYIGGDLLNQGTISVAHPDARLAPRGESRNPKLVNGAGAGITIAPLGKLTVTGGVPVELQGGFLSGSGILAANLVNSGGDVRPGGNAVGTLDLQGAYTQAGGGTLAADVATSAGVTSNDRLAVTGAASVAGRLEIDTTGGHPALGTRLQILTASSRSGTFDEVNGLLGGAYAVEYFPNRIELVTVDAADVPSLSIGDDSVLEGNAGSTDLVFPVTISPPPDAGVQVKVDYATSDDSAHSPSDYASRSGTLTFAPGDASEEIHVPVNGDTAGEPDEALLVRLRDPSAAGLSDGRAIGTIIGDDVSLAAVSPDRGGTPGSTTMTVTGTGFGPTSTLKLSRGGDEIVGAHPVADATGTHLTATFDLAAAELGDWNVTATGIGGSATSSGGFTVDAGAGGARARLGNGPDRPAHRLRRPLRRHAAEHGQHRRRDRLHPHRRPGRRDATRRGRRVRRGLARDRR